jgi:hypothetical protein
MTNYVKSTNFATKDTLTSGDPLKIVKGTEINTEFDNIATAVATKADLASPTFTGTVVIPTVTISAGTITSTTIASPTITSGTLTDYTETAPASVNSGTSQTISLSSGTVLRYTLTGNCTFTMPTATAGKSFIVMLTQDGTGGRTATFTSVKYPSGIVPVMTTTATTGFDIFSFVSNGTNWYGNAIQAFA